MVGQCQHGVPRHQLGEVVGPPPSGAPSSLPPPVRFSDFFVPRNDQCPLFKRISPSRSGLSNHHRCPVAVLTTALLILFLQAIAAGLGGSAMAAVLAALSLNYKHFEGGLPDLLLVRAVRTDRGTYARKEDDAVSAMGVETARGVAASAAASLAIEAKVEMDTEVSMVRVPRDSLAV